MIQLFQFPRMFAIPNLSPFCCKMETWLRIAGLDYEVVDTPNPRGAPRGKLPFIEDGGERITDTSLIIEHLEATRGVDPDSTLDPGQRAIALLVQRTLEEHYAFVLAYTHLFHEEGAHLRHRRRLGQAAGDVLLRAAARELTLTPASAPPAPPPAPARASSPPARPPPSAPRRPRPA